MCLDTGCGHCGCSSKGQGGTDRYSNFCCCCCCCVQVWRGEHYACTHSEYLQVKRQLMAEMHGGPAAAAAAAAAGGDGEASGPRSWAELSSEEQGKLLKERLKKYTQKVRAGPQSSHSGAARFMPGRSLQTHLYARVWWFTARGQQSVADACWGVCLLSLPVCPAGVQACAGQACGGEAHGRHLPA